MHDFQKDSSDDPFDINQKKRWFFPYKKQENELEIDYNPHLYIL
jgi:hypothetical protein